MGKYEIHLGCIMCENFEFINVSSTKKSVTFPLRLKTLLLHLALCVQIRTTSNQHSQDFVKGCQNSIYTTSLQLFILPFCVIIDCETADMFSLWFSAFAMNSPLLVVPRAL